MKKKELRVGDILQINSFNDLYSGQLLICTEPKPWGCKGVLFLDCEYENLVRSNGRAFLKVKFNEVELVGRAKWIWEEINNEPGSFYKSFIPN